MPKALIPNRIVKVITGKAKGNKPGTIVKVLSKPGRFVDQVATVSSTLYGDKIMDKVLCESITGPQVNTLNNKVCCYEYINDLMPATEYEKIQRTLGNQPGNITIIH